MSGDEGYTRYGKRDRAGGGRTLIWLLLIVIVVGATGLAVAWDRIGGDDAPPPAPAAAEPAQRLLIREGLRREDIAAVLDRETTISGDRYLVLTGPGQRGRRLARTGRPTSLEGFLFPATYEITSQTTAANLVDLQIAAYETAESQVNYS
ncbi:MAG: endolytic transglycosylase MltG, partial [Thermoleophilia bacterium]